MGISRGSARINVIKDVGHDLVRVVVLLVGLLVALGPGRDLILVIDIGSGWGRNRDSPSQGSNGSVAGDGAIAARAQGDNGGKVRCGLGAGPVS